MKEYPSILKSWQTSTSGIWHGWDKLDGSLIRVEWNPKRGFYKFGRRNGLLDHSNPYLLEAPALIQNHSTDLTRYLKDRRATNAVLFFEFFGPNSFAGNHQNEFHKVVLIDAAIDKKGLIPPKDLMEISDYGVPTPALVWTGHITQELLASIEDGSLESMTFEGVVFKRSERNKRLMFKHKNKAWLEKLKNHCGGDQKLFDLLS